MYIGTYSRHRSAYEQLVGGWIAHKQVSVCTWGSTTCVYGRFEHVCMLPPQEYVEYYGGAGVQHIALNTSDIINTVSERLSLLCA